MWNEEQIQDRAIRIWLWSYQLSVGIAEGCGGVGEAVPPLD
jgi:hypothetical protein